MKGTSHMRAGRLPPFIRSRVDQTADTLQFGSPTAIYHQVFSPATKRHKYGFILVTIVVLMAAPTFALIAAPLSTPGPPGVVLVSRILFFSVALFTLLLASLLFRLATIPWYVFLYAEGLISAKGRKIVKRIIKRPIPNLSEPACYEQTPPDDA